jgi:phosphoglycerol transferase MdoB-like AlkP superfamily enzyme
MRTCDSTAIEEKSSALLYPFTPLVLFYLQSLGIFSVSRLVLYLQYFDSIREVANHLQIFSVGFRLDTILLCRLIAPIFLLQVCTPAKISTRFCRGFSLYFALLASLFVFLEIVGFAFVAEFYMRPNLIFLEYIVQVHEIFDMIIRGHSIGISLSLMGAVLAGWLTFRVYQRLFKNSLACSWAKMAGSAVFVATLLVIGGRSALIGQAGDINLAAFSSSHLVNQLAVNSTYSLGLAFYRQQMGQKEPQAMYGTMNPEEMLARVRTSALIPEGDCHNPAIPLLHYQSSRFSPAQPLNLVIILTESLGAEYMGCLGGLPLTPNIDALSRQGVLFTRLYSTGIRTVRGIESIISGFLPTPGESIVKRSSCQNNFFTLPELLRRRGYVTEFIYGGRGDFDNMRTFFLGHGFDKIYDKDSIAEPFFTSTWGVSDEDLFQKANDILRSHEGNPFFSLILTTTNHDPFEFPDGRIILYEQPKQTRNNALKYTDYALGKFFEMAKKETYYKNTLFLIIADHSNRLHGSGLIPVHKFHIGGLLIGPDIRPGTYDKIASQIDMIPTLLNLMGISADHPVPGRALFSLPDTVKGRAIMQYGDTNAFMEEDRVVVLRPELEPVQFTYSDGRLIPAELDPELAKTARAHALLPGHLCANRLHHLPAESPDK